MRLVVREPIGQNPYWMSFSELTSNPNCIIGYSPRRDPQRAIFIDKCVEIRESDGKRYDEMLTYEDRIAGLNGW
jgi:hypothetical protein